MLAVKLRTEAEAEAVTKKVLDKLLILDAKLLTELDTDDPEVT
jgi:hypothetical protein